eukprot:COSAG01_NODE_3827_length_5655_cov_143.098452_2_plen_192_part_00
MRWAERPCAASASSSRSSSCCCLRLRHQRRLRRHLAGTRVAPLPLHAGTHQGSTLPRPYYRYRPPCRSRPSNSTIRGITTLYASSCTKCILCEHFNAVTHDLAAPPSPWSASARCPGRGSYWGSAQPVRARRPPSSIAAQLGGRRAAELLLPWLAACCCVLMEVNSGRLLLPVFYWLKMRVECAGRIRKPI